MQWIRKLSLTARRYDSKALLREWRLLQDECFEQLFYPAVMNEVWRVFLQPCTHLVEFYECRGTKPVNITNLSRCRMILNDQERLAPLCRSFAEIGGAGHKSRCWEFFKEQKIKAKTVTSFWIIPSVLVQVLFKDLFGEKNLLCQQDIPL